MTTPGRPSPLHPLPSIDRTTIVGPLTPFSIPGNLMVAAVSLRQFPVTLYGANDPYLAPSLIPSPCHGHQYKGLVCIRHRVAWHYPPHARLTPPTILAAQDDIPALITNIPIFHGFARPSCAEFRRPCVVDELLSPSMRSRMPASAPVLSILYIYLYHNIFHMNII